MIRSACEPIFEKPLAEISFGMLLIYLFQVARRFGITSTAIVSLITQKPYLTLKV